MNPLLARVIGTSARFEEQAPSASAPAPVVEDVPVPCAAMTRSSFRDRLRKRRKEEDMVQRVMGEARQEEPLIPADAEDYEPAGQPFQKGMKPVKDVVMEPNDPYAGKEKLATPSAALVAPDVTPDAEVPLDPSKVPGMAGNRFRMSDVEREGAEPAAPEYTQVPNRAMDALLGRPKPPTETAQPDAVVTAESAYAMLGVQSPNAQHLAETAPAGQVLLKEGQAMPDHVASDGRQVLSAFRRFVRC